MSTATRIRHKAALLHRQLGNIAITYDSLAVYAREHHIRIIIYGDNDIGDCFLRQCQLSAFAAHRESFARQLENGYFIFLRFSNLPDHTVALFAHELGHILLGHHLGHLQPLEEAEANYFAALLLGTCAASTMRPRLAIVFCILLIVPAGIWAFPQFARPAPAAATRSPVPTFTAPAIVPDAPQLSPESPTSLSASSASSNTDKLVYFTVSGKKFHNVYCYTIKGKSTFCAPMSEARKKGLEPCLACRPDM